MLHALLLMAWPHQGRILTSFRWATDYFMPETYTGNATLTQISSQINATNYELIFRCRGCLSWVQLGFSGNISSRSGLLGLGRAQATDGPQEPDAGCPDRAIFGFHDNGYGQLGAHIGGVPNRSYSQWASLATTSVADSCNAVGPHMSGPLATSISSSTGSTTKISSAA